MRSDGSQGTLALSGLDSRPSARKGYPCEAGPTCFALSNSGALTMSVARISDMKLLHPRFIEQFMLLEYDLASTWRGLSYGPALLVLLLILCHGTTADGHGT